MQGVPNDPGEMKERIILYAPGNVVTKGGIVKKNTGATSPEIKRVFAKIRHLSGREFYSAMQTAVEVEIEATIRYRTNIDTSNFFRWQNQDYDIVRVVPTPCRSYMTLFGRRRTDKPVG